ncbi:GNAT family N-acetyltransferase [Gelidibacter mesophilus]|uniref:GNAT family N-acetyltransferase n=1 Tax=Gelidibacter mesophilus TaxID=169050 RepID=UPI00316AD009
MATNPDFRGRNFVKIIVDWAINLAKEQNKQFIRMDTCGKNEGLITHYQRCGFDFLGTKKLNNVSHLPAHYHNVEVCFFEIQLS